MSQNEIQQRLLTAIAVGDASEAQRLVSEVKNKDKSSFKDWLKKLTSIFEVHLTVKLLGIQIIDFRIPKD